MTRRTLISSMIAEQLAAANSGSPQPESQVSQRVAAGPVRTMGLTLDKLEMERKSLETALAEGSGIVELAPEMVEASFAADRFVGADDTAFDELKQSIAENGQEVPILVRPLEGRAGFYQVAYGHRRLRACRDLGRPVKAIVRVLTDSELVIAQGLENASRVDLTFIEKASFARGLEQRGFERTTIMAALSTDKTELSKLLSTIRALPEAVIRAIGPAPRAGRRRWMQLADLIENPSALQRVEILAGTPEFAAADTDVRFVKALNAATVSDAVKAQRKAHRMMMKTPDGKVFAKIEENDRHFSLQIDRKKHTAFADYLLRELPDLYTQFLTADAQQDRNRR